MRSEIKVYIGYKINLYSRQNIVMSACFFIIFIIFSISSLSAAPVLNESTLNAGSSGVTVGSFDGGGIGLLTIANLPDTSAADRNFVSQTFTPSVTGTYIFGISNSNQDTVLILYDTTFDPSNPTVNSIVLNDDSDGLGAGGVVMGRCGANARLCPRISANLEGGKTFQIVITSFRPARTVSDGVSFYIFGEPVIVGSIEAIAEDPIVVEAVEDITVAVELNLKNIIQNFMKNDRDQLDSAVQRHIARLDKLAEEKNKLHEREVNVKRHILRLEKLIEDRQKAYKRRTKKLIVENPLDKSFDGSTISPPKKLSNPKQSVDSNTEPKTLLVYDGSIFEFTFNTTTNEKLSDDTDLIISQNLFYFENDNGNLSKNANINFNLERLFSEKSTLGASLGFQYNKTRQKFPEIAENKHSSFSLGVYGLTSATQDLILAWHSAFLLGKGDVNSNASTVHWKTEYDTQGITAGISTTGKIKTKLRSKFKSFGKVQIWPKLNLNYGSVESTSLQTRITIGSISDSVIVSSEPVQVKEASFSPDFKIEIKGGEHFLLGDILTISPGARCQIIDSSTTLRVCGSQLRIYLSKQNDGMKLAEIQFEKSRSGEGASFWAGLRLPL